MNARERNEALTRALEIQSEIERLQAEQDALLDNIVKTAMAEGRTAVERLVHVLPTGFYRTELRTWLAVHSKE